VLPVRKPECDKRPDGDSIVAESASVALTWLGGGGGMESGTTGVSTLSASASPTMAFVAEQGVRFVTTSAGDPSVLTASLHDVGITVFHVVPHLRGALKAIVAGVDGLVVEGGEGGGFKQSRDVATMVLLPLICGAVDVPVIAAGGIVDGRSMAAAFVLGAEGVQMGTRMVSAAESPVYSNWKELIVRSAETDSVMLNRWGKPAFRVLATPYSEARERDERVAFPALDQLLKVYFEGDRVSRVSRPEAGGGGRRRRRG